MGRFETEILTQSENLELLMNQAGEWIDRVCDISNGRYGCSSGTLSGNSSPNPAVAFFARKLADFARILLTMR